jgi:hypothetical protein
VFKHPPAWIDYHVRRQWRWREETVIFEYLVTPGVDLIHDSIIIGLWPVRTSTDLICLCRFLRLLTVTLALLSPASSLRLVQFWTGVILVWMTDGALAYCANVGRTLQRLLPHRGQPLVLTDPTASAARVRFYDFSTQRKPKAHRMFPGAGGLPYNASKPLPVSTGPQWTGTQGLEKCGTYLEPQ